MPTSEVKALLSALGRLLVLRAFDISRRYDIKDIVLCPFGAMAAIF